jgi:hypothetical protein
MARFVFPVSVFVVSSVLGGSALVGFLVLFLLVLLSGSSVVPPVVVQPVVVAPVVVAPVVVQPVVVAPVFVARPVVALCGFVAPVASVLRAAESAVSACFASGSSVRWAPPGWALGRSGRPLFGAALAARRRSLAAQGFSFYPC